MARKGKQSAKVEPKTFFANERTFIQWIGCAILLTVFCGQMMTTNKIGRVIGTALWTLGLVLVVYALVQYKWRLGRIMRKDPRGYDDRYGPTVLAVIVGIMMITIMAVAWSINFDENDSGSTLDRVTLDGNLDSLNLGFGVFGAGGGEDRSLGFGQRSLTAAAAGGGSSSSASGARGVVVFDADAKLPSAAVCDYEAAATKCPAISTLPSDLGGAIDYGRVWPASAFGERLSRERFVSGLADELDRLAERRSLVDACADIAALSSRMVVNELTELYLAVGSQQLFQHDEDSANIWLRTPFDAPAGTTAVETAAAAAMAPKQMHRCAGAGDGNEAPGNATPGESMRLMGLPADSISGFLAEHPSVDGSASQWAKWYFSAVTFDLEIAGSPAQIALKIEYPSDSERAYSRGASSASLTLTLLTGGTSAARVQATWLLDHLTCAIGGSCSVTTE